MSEQPRADRRATAARARFRGCLMGLAAVNLGDDADTTGAIYGQLAGAYYGVDAIPPRWRERVALAETILDFADRLHAVGVH